MEVPSRREQTSRESCSDLPSRTIKISQLPLLWGADPDQLSAKLTTLLEEFGSLHEQPIIVQDPPHDESPKVYVAYVTFECAQAASSACKCLHLSDNRIERDTVNRDQTPAEDHDRFHVTLANYADCETFRQKAKKQKRTACNSFFNVNMARLSIDPPAMEDLDSNMRNQLCFIGQYDPPTPDQSPSTFLAPREYGSLDKSLTLVLDLDGTLAESRPLHTACVDSQEGLKLQLNDSQLIVYFRPGVQAFLLAVAQLFEVVIFTASIQAYADQVLNHLDPSAKLISARLFRQHCLSAYCESGQVVFLKDLGLLGRPLERVILVDDSPMSHFMHPDNGILVSSWTADQIDDHELVDLLDHLKECHRHATKCGSVTDHLVQRYGLRDFFHSLRTSVDQDQQMQEASQASECCKATESTE